MPDIRIVVSENKSQEELFLLEFQGKFETNSNIKLSGMEVGKLDTNGVTEQLKSSFILLIQ